MTKAARTTRRPDKAIALTPRDHDLMTVVGLSRFISVEQLAHVFFPSADRCRTRVRQLFDAGVVDVTLVSSTAPSLVSLSRLGRAILRDTRPEVAARLTPIRAFALHAVPHHLLIVEMRLGLARIMRDGHLDALRVDAPAEDAASWRRFGLVPDATALVERFGTRHLIALEADRGTEQDEVVVAKLARYERALAAGTADRIVVAVEADLEVARIERLVRRAGVDRMSVVVSRAGLRSGDSAALAARLWRTRAP